VSNLFKETEPNQLDNHIHSKVERHETKLVKIETILERVAVNQDNMAKSLASISTSISKQELLLEKLTNLEVNTKESINRIHRRIDDEVANRNEKLQILDKAIVDLDLARVLSKYPKVAIAVFVVSYLFTIKEFRDIITGIGGN
jgi:hypothetical protein